MADQWNLAGTYFETCNCDVACPCVFLSPPTTGECTALVGWHIDKGRSGTLNLDGLNVALAVYSPGHMAQGKWQVALYLDDQASQAQKDALTPIFAGQAGGHFGAIAPFIGQVLGVKSVPITFQATGKKRSLQVANLAHAEIEAVEGQGGADVVISNHPLTIAPGKPAVVAKSKHLSYADHGLKWEVSEKNGFYSAFAYQGP